ncbi:MAG: hypothetical protein QM256_00495 [Pseudomonadota bacterium]|jgi:hypothetical protein|nr:hypothetical protein [Syntrophaceae bacterium]MDI9554246.1 hypothetical protein [Pseudomonadota bacterium]HNZ34298.1 hypothetical protein [Syntrophales bacterium]HPL71190.1 hypothetical protein [Rectinema sp.]HPV53294.1 hypothetical protein [Syntrophales bacterium]
MFNRLEAINKALLASEYAEAAILSKKLRMTVTLSQELETKIIDELEKLLD